MYTVPKLEDYSPEYWAATAGKGAAVLNMLRSVIGDDNFFKLLKAIPERFTWKSISTDDFKKLVENFLPLPPCEGQGAQRAPEEQDDFANILKHNERCN